VCGTAGHAETSRWAERLGRVGLLHVVAKRGVAPIGGAKNLLDFSGQSVNDDNQVKLCGSMRAQGQSYHEAAQAYARFTFVVLTAGCYSAGPSARASLGNETS
jgi:hypothetical protein